MKQIKIKKSWLRDLPLLLRSVGVVVGDQAYPSDVYASKKDIATIRREVARQARREGLRGKRLQMAVAADMLNLGPNETLKESIKPGYLIVDSDSIANRKADSK